MNGTILISGKAGSGKDATAQFMKEELEKHGQRVLIIHFADAVKWVCREFFQWDGQKDAVGRTLLQYVGTDVVRTTFPGYWTGIVVGLIKAFEPYNDFDVAIVPDARFPNEVDTSLVTLNNCVAVRVERKNSDGTEWINPNLTDTQRQHPSETSLDCYGFDYILHNDTNIETLREGAITILKDLGYIKE